MLVCTSLIQLCSLEVLRTAMMSKHRKFHADGDSFAHLAIDLFTPFVMEIVELLQALYNYGIVAGWLVIIGGQTAIVASSIGKRHLPDFFRSYETCRVFGIISAGALMLMLSAQRKMSGLKFASILGILCVMYLIVVVCIGFVRGEGECAGTALMDWECVHDQFIDGATRANACLPGGTADVKDAVSVSIDACLHDCGGDGGDCYWQSGEARAEDLNSNAIDLLKAMTIVSFSFINRTSIRTPDSGSSCTSMHLCLSVFLSVCLSLSLSHTRKLKEMCTWLSICP